MLNHFETSINLSCGHSWFYVSIVDEYSSFSSSSIWGDSRHNGKPGGQMFLAAKTATLPDLDQSTCRFRVLWRLPSGVIIAMGNRKSPNDFCREKPTMNGVCSCIFYFPLPPLIPGTWNLMRRNFWHRHWQNQTPAVVMEIWCWNPASRARVAENAVASCARCLNMIRFILHQSSYLYN